MSLLILLAAAVGLLIVSISKWKLHPFLAIMGVSVLFAIISGMELTTIADVIGEGFSSAFTSIGIVIILGALIGSILEKTGAALKVADVTIRLTGKKNPELALLMMGRIVSMAVFCDSAFVVLDPVRKALIKRTGKPDAACTMALSLGLYITQCFIPPAPGPIASANALFGSMGLETDLLLVLGVGMLCSLLPTIVSFLFAIKQTVVCERNAEAYDKLISASTLPGAFMSLAPILLPILLMALSSAAELTGAPPAILVFLGEPMIALASGLLMAILLLQRSGKMDTYYELTESTLRAIAPILLVIAAGSVLGQVIAATDLESIIKAHAASLQNLGLLFPFLLGALLKTALGSSTVAITTTSGILAPLMHTLGFLTPVDAALAVCAIAAGSMTVCHANDSYFWVVVNMGGLKPQDGYRTLTTGTFLAGLTGLINVLLVSLIL